jgi:hypothetical protein
MPGSTDRCLTRHEMNRTGWTRAMREGDLFGAHSGSLNLSNLGRIGLPRGARTYRSASPSRQVSAARSATRR